MYSRFAEIMFALMHASYFTQALIAVASVLCMSLWLTRGKPSKLPPGPRGLPLIGSLPFIDTRSEKTFAKWSKLYGPVMFIKLGAHPTVVLNDLECINQAFVKQGNQFNGRFKTFLSEFASECGKGIFFIDDPEDWKTQRRFGLRALSGSGLEGRSLESRILEEANLLCDVIRSKGGKPFVLEKDLSESISNVVTDITLKRRCTDQENERLRDYVTRLVTGFRSHGMAYILMVVAPWVRHFPPIKAYYKQMKAETILDIKMFMSFIDEMEEKMDKQNPSGFAEQFLAEIPKPTFTKQQLRIYIKDILFGGTETSTTSIRWILLYLIRNPDIQQKVHDEIDAIIGRDGRVSFDCDLPYTKAVVQEGYRIRTAVPLTLPRRSYQDVEFMGYIIPKNTQILGNLWAVHNDPNHWPNPDEFKPERHLDTDGKFVRSDRVIPFSVGARNCLGENLARMEVFLFLVSFLQKFEVLPNPVNPNPSMEGTPGPVYSPQHYPLIMKER